tara:strand:+ start:1133 stop:2035 length:903 start_codon:yes stop_codon:yes gene_type:complete
MKDLFYNYIKTLQDKVTREFESIDGKAIFKEDLWERTEGGGGRTRIIENGNVIEKGGVNISAVHGELPKSMQDYFNVRKVDFFACGLSLVIHPLNPMAPSVHANWRYFEMYNKEGGILEQWFGGGLDLTPFYLFEEDVKHFHQTCKAVCDRHNSKYYLNFKQNCDTYFFNKHRNEARGVGGIFFDYLKKNDTSSMKDHYKFVSELGDSFLNAYTPLLKKRKNIKYTNANKIWQEVRRGRYVEFNLIQDKGTLFGLQTNGRIESILMSLPPKAQWKYNYHPEPNSEEARLLQVLESPRDWA